VELDTGKGFARVSRGNVGTVAIAIKSIVIFLDFWSERVWLCWASFGNSEIPMHVHIWFRIRWRWRGIVYRIVIGSIDLSRILHFALPVHNRISYWPRDALSVSALLVITSHMRVMLHLAM